MRYFLKTFFALFRVILITLYTTRLFKLFKKKVPVEFRPEPEFSANSGSGFRHWPKSSSGRTLVGRYLSQLTLVGLFVCLFHLGT